VPVAPTPGDITPSTSARSSAATFPPHMLPTDPPPRSSAITLPPHMHSPSMPQAADGDHTGTICPLSWTDPPPPSPFPSLNYATVSYLPPFVPTSTFLSSDTWVGNSR
jgi:hypothetical protein